MNIGIDIIENKRIKSKMKRKSFIDRILSLEEQKKFNSFEKKIDKINFLSGRFSAKESIIKASDKKMIFTYISIINSASGKPEVYYKDEKMENIFVSISHEKKYSVSFATIIERKTCF